MTACAPRFDPQSLEIISETSQVSLSRAMLVPSIGTTPIIGVLESRYTNAYVQELILQTDSRRPGQSRYHVTFMLPGETGGPGTRDLEVRRIDPFLIQKELAERFPDVAMEMSAYFVQNRFGPFGFATGRTTAGDTCIYAWQTITRSRAASLIDGVGGRIDIRLDMCDSGASVGDLLEMMYGFTINAYLARWNWQPYDGTPSLNPDIGTPGEDIRPPVLTPPDPQPLSRSPVRPAAAREAAAREAPARSGRQDAPLELIDFLDVPPPATRNTATGRWPAESRGDDPVDLRNYPTIPLPPP
ncbi:cellulose biosynthesis protein BcsN [Pseudochelatococcus contaminans]|uniref:Cellulose biosynthesis protein BcsN n=1 Tax=Pseudochelatococcus contaminans TaxID=1538103 RepID=A0A7W5Z4Q1_9HYPH|nr:cellulose biosynthesis protein BcsN [Pseudochelatococcus contaminans]MBB3810146.1 hypothetical protein [Pseudochelatococcus contaminans]